MKSKPRSNYFKVEMKKILTLAVTITTLLLILSVSLVSAPEWTSTVPADYNTGTGFDFNWTKVTGDGNVMPTGSDKVYVEQNQAFYDNGLVAYWNFDDVNSTGDGIIDDTNNNKNGLLINGADINALGLWDTNALFLDGVDDRMLADVTVTGTPYTMCAWFNTSITSTTRTLVSVYYNSVHWGIIQISGNGKSVYTGIRAGGTAEFSPTVAVELNQWYHVCGVFAADDERHLYVDGTFRNTDTASVTPTAFIGTQIGYNVDSYPFPGIIDEVKIYNRALTTDEIAADYNSWMKSSYDSPIKDAGAKANWDTIRWQEATDVNNSLTVSYRGCSAADCAGASAFVGNLSGGGIEHLNINVDGNRYFQYRVSFDTNKASWNTVRSFAVEDGDRGMFAKISDVNVTYTRLPDVNVWKVDGNPVNEPMPSFSQAVDGNLTIDFNYTSDQNYLPAHNVDINFSTSQDQGTGTNIVEDLNVDGNFCRTNLIRGYTEPGSDINLVGYYKFDGVNIAQNIAFDFSGKGNHGQYQNGADNNMEGKWDTNSAFLDGIDDGVVIGTGSDFNSLCTGGCSFSAWVNKENGDDLGVILGRWDTLGDNRYFIFWINQNEELRFDIDSDGTATSGCSDIVSGFDLILNTWEHVAIVWDTSNINFYRNGILRKQTGCTITIDEAAWKGTENTFIGMHDDGGSRYEFPGGLEEVKMYDKALTASEIMQDYNTSAANKRVCSWDWNITGVADGNYFVNIISRELGFETDYSTSDNSFKIDNSAPDLNIWRIDTYDALAPLPLFSYSTDGNLTIDFNIATWDVNFGQHWLDLNYDTVNTPATTGTAIVENLKVDGNLCQTNLIRGYADLGTDTNLVGYWKFNGDTNQELEVDWSGNGNNGQYINGADNNAQGKWDTNAGWFAKPGIDDYINIAPAASLDVNLFFTIIAWIKTPDLASYRTIISKTQNNSDGSYPQWNLKVWNTGEIDFRATDDTATQSRIKSDAVIDDDEWHHIALVRNNSYLMYIDGILDDTQVANSGVINNGSVQIGVTGNSDYDYAGLIEEVKLYKTALTISEIQADYKYGRINKRICEWDWDISGIEDNNYFVNATVKDDARNTDFNASNTFQVVNNPPTTVGNDFNNTWQNTDANMQFSCSDSEENCNNFYYSLDDTNYQFSWGLDQNRGIILTTDGNHEIFYWSDDTWDNNESANLIYLAIDKTIPTASISSPTAGSSQTSTTVTLQYTGSDSGSGIAKYWVKADSGSWIDNSTNTSYAFTSQSVGSHNYYVKATDSADNNSSEASVALTISSTTTTTTTSGTTGSSSSGTGMPAYPDLHMQDCVEEEKLCFEGGVSCCPGLRCLDRHCEKAICAGNIDCSAGEECINGLCQKIIWLEILRADLNIAIGERLDFTYLASNYTTKSIDAKVYYWLEKGGEKVIEGADEIVLLSGEQRELDVNMQLGPEMSGKYTLGVEIVSADRIKIDSKTIQVGEIVQLELDLLISRLPSVITEQPLSLRLTIGSNYDEEVKIRLNQVILKNNEIIWQESKDLAVKALRRLTQEFPELESGDYKWVLTVSSGNAVKSITREVRIEPPQTPAKEGQVSWLEQILAPWIYLIHLLLSYLGLA